MALVSDKLNAAKPPVTTEKGKLPPGHLNNNKDLDVEIKKEEPGFFGSFWNQKAGGKQKKVGAATMESVSWTGGYVSLDTDFHDIDGRVQPPPVIKPQSALNERETMETEVISECCVHSIGRAISGTLTCGISVYRAAHPLVLQHCETGDDRYGSQGHHVDAGEPLEGEPAERAVAGAVQARGVGRPAEGERVCREQEEGSDFDGAGA